MSYPKSGRTWLRATLPFYFEERYGLDTPPLLEFASGTQGGLRTMVEFLNVWADALDSIPNSHCLSYEAMHAESEKTLTDALRFLGEHPDPIAVTHAIERAHFDKLKALEKFGAFESGRPTPVDTEDSESFKVRRSSRRRAAEAAGRDRRGVPLLVLHVTFRAALGLPH